jgi:hypothetical protein
MNTGLLAKIWRKWSIGYLQLPLERLVEDGREQGIHFGGGLGLPRLQGIHLRLDVVQVGDDAALLFQRR